MFTFGGEEVVTLRGFGGIALYYLNALSLDLGDGDMTGLWED